MTAAPVFVVLSGLPGVGKTTIARVAAPLIEAVYLRIDTIETALARSVLHIRPAEDAGYVAAYGLALDNLRLGRNVLADSVNPLAITRAAFAEVARTAGVLHLDVEIVCGDEAAHRERVESRAPDLEGQRLPTWDAVRLRDYEPWTTPRLVLDTARLAPEAAAARIAEQVARLRETAS